MNDFGRHSRAWCETDVERTDLESVVSDLMAGQYSNPLIIVAFNMTERWSQDVSEFIAREIQMRADLAHSDLSSSMEEFVTRHAGQREQQLARRL